MSDGPTPEPSSDLERGRLDRLRRSVHEGSARLTAARVDHPLIDAGFQVVSRDRLVVGGLLASAVAFRVELSGEFRGGPLLLGNGSSIAGLSGL